MSQKKRRTFKALEILVKENKIIKFKYNNSKELDWILIQNKKEVEKKIVKQKPECRYCQRDTVKHKVLKRKKLVKFEETDEIIDLICLNSTLVRHPVGYDNKGSKEYKFFKETCESHILLLKPV